MKALEEINALMKGGRTGEAKAELECVLASEPENVEARLLWGTCCQLLGEDAGFRKVYDELGPQMDGREQAGEKSRAVELWTRYKRVAAALFVVGMVALTPGEGLSQVVPGNGTSPTNRHVVVQPPRPMPAYAVRPNPPVPPRPIYGVRPPQPGPPRPLHKYGVPRPPQPPPPPPMPQPCTKYAVPPELIRYPRPPVAPPVQPKPPLTSGLFDGMP